VTRPLAGLTVVVTRPEHQAARFSDLAVSRGAGVVALPALAIDFVDLDARAREALAPDAHDWAIYTSANAVEAAARALPAPARCRVAAVGRATARALAAQGIRVDAVPAERADSEGLLALPDFAGVRGLRVLVLRGVGGRELLRDEFTKRGAQVTIGELYRRRPPVADPAAIAALAAAVDSGRDVVVAVTSVEVLDGLLGLLPSGLAERLRSAPLLLPGERVAAAARDRGWTGDLIVAATAEDGAMIAALEAHEAARRARPPA
jgi:uroporphyrinogen-III synthase